MKRKLVWILMGLAVLIVAALIGLLPNPQDLYVKEESLPRDQAVLIKTRADSIGVQKGDAFRYLVRILYNPDQVSEIDRAALDKNVHWEPFEIRKFTDTELVLDARTRVFQREFELQLISGEVNHLYEFPTLVVRYSLKDSKAVAEKSVVPEPVYVAARLPTDVVKMDLGYGEAYGPLRGVKQEIVDSNQDRLPWILMGLGGLVGAVALADLNRRIVRHRKESGQPTIQAENRALYEAYRSLHANVAMGVEPRRLLHQIDHILTVVLAQKERIDWLEEPNLDYVSSETREPMRALYEKSQKASGAGVVEHAEVEQALTQLDEILGFHFGQAEITAWRR